MSRREINCFVIMPISDTTEKHTKQYWSTHFKSFLKPLIEDCPNVKAHRSKALREDILRKIITDLITSPIVVADLTDMNPNVYWELGVRQSFKHGSITIAEEGTEIPFDIGVKGVLFYCDNHLENAGFIRDFKDAVNDIISNPDTPDSHVLETISGRGSLYQIIHQEESIRRLEAIMSEFKHNQAKLDEILKIIKDRKAKPGQSLVERFRTSAVNLLITNRYLDEDQNFYSVAEQYSTWVIAHNEALGLWQGKEEQVDTWFMKAKDGFIKKQEEFRSAVSKARERLGVRS